MIVGDCRVLEKRNTSVYGSTAANLAFLHRLTASDELQHGAGNLILLDLLFYQIYFIYSFSL